MKHVDWYPGLWFDATRGLSAEQRGIYFELVNLMYLTGGPLYEDHRWLAATCGISRRKFTAILETLINLHKIRRKTRDNQAFIIANRVEDELERCENRIEQRVQARAARTGNKRNQGDNSNGRCNDRTNGRRAYNTKNQQESPLTPPPRLAPGGQGEGLDEEAKPEADPPIEAKPEADASIPIAEAKPSTLPEAGAFIDPGKLLQSLHDPPPAAADGEPFPVPGSRAGGTNPRAIGTGLRQRGVNPRAIGTNPRARPPPKIPPAPAPTGPPELAAMWETLRAEIGEPAFRAWLAPLEVGAVNGAAVLRAPSRFHRDFVAGRYADRMRTASGMPIEIAVCAAAHGAPP